MGAPTACRRMVSGTLSLFCPKCFSPFPHGTGSLSVSGEYLALPDGPGRFTQDSSCPALLRIPLGPGCVRVRDCHPLRCNFPDASAPHQNTMTWSYYPADALPHMRFGLFPGRSPLLGESLLFSSPGGTKMFQFPPFASPNSSLGMPALQTGGLSHSEITGSMAICAYPVLIAAYHVLHRLREPRHPPCALVRFLRLRTVHACKPLKGAMAGSGTLAHTFSCILRLVFQSLSHLQSCLCQYVKDL